MENRVYSSLREFQKANHKSNNITPQVGDIVNIFEGKQPRQNWLLGRTAELISSKDNLARAAKIYIGKTKRVIERPVNKLYPVEYNDEFKRKKKKMIMLTGILNELDGKQPLLLN